MEAAVRKLRLGRVAGLDRVMVQLLWEVYRVKPVILADCKQV